MNILSNVLCQIIVVGNSEMGSSHVFSGASGSPTPFEEMLYAPFRFFILFETVYRICWVDHLAVENGQVQ
jgi:hypothetical protein